MDHVRASLERGHDPLLPAGFDYLFELSTYFSEYVDNLSIIVEKLTILHRPL
jgi:hypothetical protein